MKNLLFIFILILFYSCDGLETVIELDLPDHEKKLVVNSSTKVGDNFTVFVTHSLDPLNNENYNVFSDAIVVINDNYNNSDTLVYIDSIYYSSFIAELGKVYTLNVDHPSYPPISTVTTLPYTVPILSSTILSYSETEPYSIIVELDFVDPAGTNYYMLNLKGFGDFDEDKPKKGIYFESNDPSLNQNDNDFDNDFDGRKAFFDDQFFNNSSKKFTLDLSVESKLDSLEVTLWSLDDDFYKYHVSRRLQNSTSGSGAFFASEPVNVFNSFLEEDGTFDGYGLFSVVAKDSFILVFD